MAFERTMLGLIAGAVAAPAFGQGTTVPAPRPAEGANAVVVESAPAEEPVEEDGEEIVVTGQRPRGSVVGDIEPELTLGGADIRAYGAANVDDLLQALAPQTQSGRGRGSERPVVLLNGRRISGFSEVRNLPPEAIVRVEVLPEEVALKYGYRADQRVVNFVLRERFRAITAEIDERLATAGGRDDTDFDLNILRITRDGRWSVDAEYERASALLETERDIVGGSPFRTLLPKTEQVALNGTYSATIFNDVAATTTAEFTATRSESLRGLAEGDTIALRPLRRRSDTRAGQIGTALNGQLADWRWSFTGNVARGTNDTRTERNADVGPPFEDRSKSTTDSGSLDLVANSTIARLPSGPVSTTLRAGFDVREIRSDTRRAGISQRRALSREIGNVQGNLDVPIASRRRDVLAAIGDLSANFNAQLERLSDFGTLRTLGGGINWNPVRPLDLIASVTDEEGAPSIQQLGDPLVTSPNERVFDFTRGETVDVARVEGGNPALRADRRRVLKLGATLRPLSETDLTLRANYTDTRIRDAIASFPAITPEIEAAFPERFLRGNDGRLLRIDTRAVNFERVDRRELRWGLNFSKPLRNTPPPGGWQAWRGRGGQGGGAPAGTESAPGQPQQGTPAAAPGTTGQPQAGQQLQRGAGGGDAPGGGGRGFGPGGGGRGGFGGGGFGGGGRGGRLQFSLYHTWRLEDSILIRRGVPELDLLGGSAAGSGGGRSRHELQAEAGWFKDGLGARLTANWRSGTRVEGGVDRFGNPTEDLRFSQLTTVNLRLFADLGQRRALVARHRWLRGSRIGLDFNNILDDRVNVRDASGLTPLSYQPGYLDPLGRSVRLSFRKLFI